MPPKLIFRYIFGLHLRYTALGLSLVLLVVFLGQFADAARHLGAQADWSSTEMLARAALRTPMLLQYVLPHVVLVAAALAIYRLGVRFELAILLLSGLSGRHLLAPLFACGAAVGLAYALLGSPVASASFRAADPASAQAMAAGHAQQVLLRDSAGISYLFVDRVLADGNALQGVSLFRFDLRHRLVGRVDAPAAQYTPAGWRLAGAVATPPGASADPWFQPPDLLVLDREAMTTRLENRHALPLLRLPAAIAFADSIGAPAHRLRFQLDLLLALPALLGAVSALAGAVVLRGLSARAWGADALRVLLTGFALYSAISLLDAMSASRQLPGWAAAWAAPVLCLAATALLLARKRL